MIVLSAVLVLAALQAPDAERIEAHAKKAGTRAYRLYENNRHVGTLTMRTAIETADGRRVAAFQDELEWTQEDGTKARITLKETAGLKDLRLVSGTYNDTFCEWVVDVEEGRARLHGGGAPDRRVKVAETTVGHITLRRLLAAAEQREGATFTLDVINIQARRVQPGHTLRCLGREAVEVGGQRVDAFKWQDKWSLQVERNGEPKAIEIEDHYWVAPEGHLVRFRPGGGLEAFLDEK